MRDKISRILGMVTLMLAILSCNLSTVAEQAATPTPAYTATQANTPTETLPPTFPPPIELPSATSIPPTETLTSIPTETPTETITPAPVLPTDTPTSTLLPYDPNWTPTPPPTIPSGITSATPKPYYTITNTAPAPTARSVSAVTAVQFTPMMDGDWSDWPNAETPSGYVVFGLPNWKNTNDLNSSFKSAYDGNYLYIAVKVIDDIYSQNSTGYNLYLGDSIEVLMDTNLDADFYTKNLSPDDYQIVVSPGKTAIEGIKEAYLYYPASIRGALKQVMVASRGIEGGYEVEIAIPWTSVNVTPYSGMHFGFALSVSDDDNPKKESQDSMVSSASERRLQNPTTWGDLVLQ